MNRRTFLPALIAAPALSSVALESSTPEAGRLKQGVTKGVFRGKEMSFEDMCRAARNAGIYGFDLIGPSEWPTLKKYGLVPTMLPGPAGGTIPDALNRKENHARIKASLTEAIGLAAQHGCPNVITFSGNRRGMHDDEGMENCALFLNDVRALAEDKGVTICMELLNSKVNHPDYMCDHSAWGVELMKRVNSPRVKLLYDIYHMQIMEGDIVRTIRENIAYIGHFHTGGNPGRHEIDDTQELNYRFVAMALADLNFTGVVSHEYTPVRDPLVSLSEAVKIFTV